MLAPRRRLVVVIGSLAFGGCNPFPSFDGFTGGAGAGNDASSADSGPGDSATCDADLSTSSDNCGSCGHDCVEGGCEAGQCLPVQLVTGEPAPYGLAIDDTRVYWTQGIDGGSIRSIDKTGDPKTLTTLVPSLPNPQFIAVDDTNLFVTNLGGAVMSAPKTGASSAMVLTPSYSGLHDLALDDAVVYYSDREPSGGIYFVSKSGGQPTRLAAANQPGSIALDTQNVYWVEFGGGNGQGLVSGQAKGNPGAQRILYSNQESLPDNITIDDANIYWTHFNGTGGISKIPKDQSAGVFLLNRTVSTTNGIATDGTDVFFTSFDQGSVNRVPNVGGSTAQLAIETVGNPVRIAVDATFIYWTASASDGIIYRLAK